MAVEFPDAFKPLFKPARYKVFWGGRGGAKSWNFARALLLLGAGERPIRVLCAREIQNSIEDSVHRLLSDQIAALGLEHAYEVLATEIRGRNGTVFFYAGLRHSINSIKSKEGIDYVWVEEADTVSRASWEKLIPTIRKDGSEIWISFNPSLDTDETYRRFVLNPPPDAVVVKVNWSDNYWFPDVLRKEMEHMKATDPDAWLNVYEGHCRHTLDGAIYAKEIREATEQGRITRVPYQSGRPVHTFWDLGRADKTSIWFAQVAGFEYHIIDFYENRGEALDHYVQELQKKPYVWGEDWLPHDAQAKLLGSKRTIEEQLRDIGRKVRIVPKVSVADGINAARTIFPQCYFDADACADGINALRRYRYEVRERDSQKRWSSEPLHDENSHACLIAGTQVRMAQGWLPVELVEIGDKVWTPSGISSVTNAGPVKMASDLIEITPSAGEKIVCTPEHKVLTRRGFVMASSLTTKDVLLTGHEWQCRLVGWLSKASNIGFRAAITGEMSGAARGHQTFTEPSTSMFTALSLMGTTSTISTAAPSTMTPQTWASWRPANTSECTRWSGSRAARWLLRATWLANALPHGIGLTKATNGTSRSESTLGLFGRGLKRIAKSAACGFGRLGLLAPSTATKIARLRRFAPEEGGTLVFDLTVEKNGCYQANGFLVSNSDAFRYLSVALREPPKAKTINLKLPSGPASATGWMR